MTVELEKRVTVRVPNDLLKAFEKQAEDSKKDVGTVARQYMLAGFLKNTTNQEMESFLADLKRASAEAKEKILEVRNVGRDVPFTRKQRIILSRLLTSQTEDFMTAFYKSQGAVSKYLEVLNRIVKEIKDQQDKFIGALEQLAAGLGKIQFKLEERGVR